MLYSLELQQTRLFYTAKRNFIETNKQQRYRIDLQRLRIITAEKQTQQRVHSGRFLFLSDRLRDVSLSILSILSILSLSLSERRGDDGSGRLRL